MLTTLSNQAVFASPANVIEWCLQANTKIKDQSMRRNNRECVRWLKKYAFRTQSELTSEAVYLAKGGDTAGAIERVLVCQCHNGDVQREIRADQAGMIEYLKNK